MTFDEQLRTIFRILDVHGGVNRIEKRTFLFDYEFILQFFLMPPDTIIVTLHTWGQCNRLTNLNLCKVNVNINVNVNAHLSMIFLQC